MLGAAGDIVRIGDQLAAFVEPLASDAVLARVGASVEIAVGGARPPQPLDRRPVAGIGAGAQEVVERHPERLGESGEACGVGVDVHVRREPGRLGGEDVLQGVVVGAAEQAHVVAGEAPRPGIDVGLDDLVGVSEVRLGIDVGNGDGDIGRAHRSLLRWVGDCPAGADGCRPRRQLQGRTESLVRWRSRPRKGPHHHCRQRRHGQLSRTHGVKVNGRLGGGRRSLIVVCKAEQSTRRPALRSVLGIRAGDSEHHRPVPARGRRWRRSAIRRRRLGRSGAA